MSDESPLDDNLSAILVKYATSWRKAEDMHAAQAAIQKQVTLGKIEELTQSGLAGLPELSHKQQEYIIDRLAALQAELGDK